MGNTTTQFKKGQPSWNKGLKGYGKWAKWHPAAEANPFYGKKHSPEAIEKMRVAKLGKKRAPHSEQTKDKISKSQIGKKRSYSGKNHWNWKGGISNENKIQRTRFLKYFQPKVFKRDDYTCQTCAVRGGNLQADHLKSWSEYPDLRFELSNCRTLCMSCHYYVTFKRKLPYGVVWGHNLSKRVAS